MTVKEPCELNSDNGKQSCEVKKLKFNEENRELKVAMPRC